MTRVKYYHETNKVYIEVQDTGEGIKQENQGKLFKLFTTFENKVEKNISGIGLGLCICKAVVEQFNGKIDFVSEPGIGTTFMFTFQLDGLGDEAEMEESSEPSVSEDDFRAMAKRKRIESFLFLDGVIDKPKDPKYLAKKKLYQSTIKQNKKTHFEE